MAAVGGVNLAEFQAAAQLALNPPPAGAAAEVVQRYGAGVAAVNTFKAAPDAWRSALAIFPAVTSVHARFICLQVRALGEARHWRAGSRTPPRLSRRRQSKTS